MQVAVWNTSVDVELICCVTKKFVQVVGGFSKLISYSGFSEFLFKIDHRFFKYNKIKDFEIISFEKPSFEYLDKSGKIRLKESQSSNAYRIYDCGKIIFKYKKQSRRKS